MPWQLELRKIDGGPDVLAAISDKITNRQPLNAVLGKRGEIELRNWFEKRNAEPNKRDWPKQGFWERIRTATAFAGADEKAARIVIADPAINQKIFGGTITPKEGKYLALAAIAEAYGKSPLLFYFLKIHRFRSGALALVEEDRTLISFKRGRGKKKGQVKLVNKGRTQTRGRVWYWLARSVTQRPDERALPTEQEFLAALLEESKDYIERVNRIGGV